MLRLGVLGELAVERDGAPVRLPQSKKTRALLAFLALSGRPQRRERLVAMFWDVPDDPRGALRWSLSKLREVVDEPDVKRIVADRETVAFEPAGAEIDLHLVAELAQRGFAQAETEELVRVADSFRGELLEGLELPDCVSYQAWLVAEREQAATWRAQTLAALVERLADTPERALAYARAAVQHGPYDAAARATLIRLLLAAGHPREAEEQLRAGRRLLGEADAAAAAELERAWSEARSAAPRVVATAASPPAAAPVEPASAGDETSRFINRPAVAVLPFENLSGDPAEDYFADGITEDLITALCHWRWFPVISRYSTFAYKGRRADVQTIARELRARYVVEGSVRRAGQRVRVTAQLIDASTGHHVWAERYDRELDDIFALQDELTEQIAVRIEPELSRHERLRLERKAPQNLEAWELSLRALALIHKGDPAELAEAQKLLARSLELDPRSSRTHAIQGYGLYQQALLDWTRDPVGSLGSFYGVAQRAVELDDGNWLAHALLGMSLLWLRRDYDLASEEVRRAVQLNPSAALAHQFLGCVLSFAGDPAGARPHLKAALRLNPYRNVTLLLADLSLCHLLEGEHEEAVYYARRAIGEFSGDVRAWQRLVAALGHLGHRDEAVQALQQLLRRQKRLTTAYLEATYPFRRPDHYETLVAGLRKAGWRPDANA